MLKGMYSFGMQEVHAAVLWFGQEMIREAERLSRLDGRNGSKDELNGWLELCKRFGLRTYLDPEGQYAWGETGEGDGLFTAYVHLGQRDPEGNGMAPEERLDAVSGPGISMLYALRISLELGVSWPFRTRICFGYDESFEQMGFRSFLKGSDHRENAMKLIALDQYFPKKDHTWSSCVLWTDSEFTALQTAEDAANYAQLNDLRFMPNVAGNHVRIDNFGSDGSKWKEPWCISDASRELGGFLATLPVSRETVRPHTFTAVDLVGEYPMLFALYDSVLDLTGNGEIARSLNDVGQFVPLKKKEAEMGGVDWFRDEVIIWTGIYANAFLKLAEKYSKN